MEQMRSGGFLIRYQKIVMWDWSEGARVCGINLQLRLTRKAWLPAGVRCQKSCHLSRYHCYRMMALREDDSDVIRKRDIIDYVN
jgi:hypothetical protein